MRRFALASAAALLVSALSMPVVGRVEGGCPNGQGSTRFFVGDPVDIQLAADAFPSLQRAIDDGFVTPEESAAGGEAVDGNNNGWICVKDVYAWSTNKSGGANAGSAGFYYYVAAMDDTVALAANNEVTFQPPESDRSKHPASEPPRSPATSPPTDLDGRAGASG